MRENLPVTNKEVMMEEGSVIVSRTDTRGIIQFMNKDFLDIAGFEEDELMKKPHNLIRHPDMPPEAFEDMWKDLKAGLPWSGYVKNRTKSGDHYWVYANAMPVQEKGETTGYISIRSRPNREVLKIVEPIYKLFREGKAKHLSIEHGRVIEHTRKARINRWLETVGSKFVLTSVVLCLPTALLAAVSIAHDPTISWTATCLSILLGSLVFAYKATSYSRRALTKKIDYLNNCLNSIMGGNYETEVNTSNDELFNIMVTVQALQAKLAYGELEKKELDRQKKIMQEKMADDFEGSVKSIVSMVAAASTELSHTAESMSKMASDSSCKASDANQEAGSTSQNVQTVASAAEELSASVNEITQQIQRTKDLVNDSMQKAQAADEIAKKLTEATQKVENAMEMISNVAGQINLLALNATIESARAGEHGKGFAVVASEVKNLASQTDKMVNDIQLVTKEMNEAATSIVSALTDISTSTSSITETTSSVASAVEQQSAATNEIAQNMQIASNGVQVISTSLGDVMNSATQAGESSAEMVHASKDLSVQAEKLRHEVEEFLNRVRAG
ncbi:MAG: methyl-accepting chemotaxis protein [Rickettsiales bacterium]